jgi:hypothetical protein
VGEEERRGEARREGIQGAAARLRSIRRGEQQEEG